MAAGAFGAALLGGLGAFNQASQTRADEAARQREFAMREASQKQQQDYWAWQQQQAEQKRRDNLAQMAYEQAADRPGQSLGPSVMQALSGTPFEGMVQTRQTEVPMLGMGGQPIEGGRMTNESEFFLPQTQAQSQQQELLDMRKAEQLEKTNQQQMLSGGLNALSSRGLQPGSEDYYKAALPVFGAAGQLDAGMLGMSDWEQGRQADERLQQQLANALQIASVRREPRSQTLTPGEFEKQVSSGKLRVQQSALNAFMKDGTAATDALAQAQAEANKWEQGERERRRVELGIPMAPEQVAQQQAETQAQAAADAAMDALVQQGASEEEAAQLVSEHGPAALDVYAKQQERRGVQKDIFSMVLRNKLF